MKLIPCTSVSDRSSNKRTSSSKYNFFLSQLLFYYFFKLILLIIIIIIFIKQKIYNITLKLKMNPWELLLHNICKKKNIKCQLFTSQNVTHAFVMFIFFLLFYFITYSFDIFYRIYDKYMNWTKIRVVSNI